MRHSGNATAARDMRKQLHIFVVEEDICVRKTQKQKQIKIWRWGATQYYIRDMDKPKLTSTGKLRSLQEVKLHMNQIKLFIQQKHCY